MIKVLIFRATICLISGFGMLIAQGDCIDTDLINPDVVCSGDFTPVCGCDGVTYSNACIAINFAGVTAYTDGACSGLDIIPPVLEVPVDVTLECSQLLELEDASATDNSGSVTLTEVTEELMGSCPGNFTLIRTFTAADPSGNVTTGIQTVTVEDTTQPVWTTPPSDLTIGCGDPMEAEAIMFNWASTSAGGNAIDNCGSASYGNDFDAIPLIDCTETVVVSIGFFAEDECGNQAWTSATLTIIPGEIEVSPCGDLAGVDFGLCDAILGIARVNGYCSEISGCGTMIGPTDYSPAFYNSIEDCVTDCNQGCISQEYLDLGTMIDCSPAVMEVCGCDGNTYQNVCHAQYGAGNVSWTDGPCIVIEFGGCTYPFACNYNPDAAFEDGSCLFPPEHCPLTPDSPGGGCMYPDAINFEVTALWDNGSCLWSPCNNGCPEDVNSDGAVTVSDILMLLGQFGLICQ